MSWLQKKLVIFQRINISTNRWYVFNFRYPVSRPEPKQAMAATSPTPLANDPKLPMTTAFSHGIEKMRISDNRNAVFCIGPDFEVELSRAEQLS